MSKRICPICGKPLPEDAYHAQKFCSLSCKKQAKKIGEQKRREYLKAHGICVKCGQQEAKKGRLHCHSCIANSRAYNAIKYERRKQQHKCAHCGKPVSETHTLCQDCINRQRERQYMGYLVCLAEGICTVCRKRKATDGHKTCDICRARIAEYDARNKRKVA